MAHVMLYIMIFLDVLAVPATVSRIGKTPETVSTGPAAFVTVLTVLTELALYFSYLHAGTGAAQLVAASLGALFLGELAYVLYRVDKPRKVRRWTGALAVTVFNALEIGALLYVIASS